VFCDGRATGLLPPGDPCQGIVVKRWFALAQCDLGYRVGYRGHEGEYLSI
jgi:hypothetical protein